MTTTDAPKKRRLDLILRQIDSLPTLPAVATRLLALTADQDARTPEIIELIAADPALTAKVLALCRQSDRGVRDEGMTVDRAVVLLGFNAVRDAVLSLKVIEVFGEPGDRPRTSPRSVPGEEAAGEGQADAAGPGGLTGFDHVNFWRHSLAVGIACELLAATTARGGTAGHGQPPLPAGEAFVCGLLHDVGKLALDHVLPKSFARAVELAELNGGNLAEFERRIIGLDHHTAGKRLAEQWRLPHQLQDCIWLHGTPYDSLPRLDHRRMIGLVGLADLLVRQRHVGYSGNFTFREDPDTLTAQIGLDPAAAREAMGGLHEELERRSRILGLDDRPSRALYLESIERANQELGRLSRAVDRRGRASARQGQVLEAIAAFHAENVPGRGVPDALAAVLSSAASVLGPGFYALLSESGGGTEAGPEGTAAAARTWLVAQDAGESQAPRTRSLEPPRHAPRLSSLGPAAGAPLPLMAVVPWIADALADTPDPREVRLLPLASGWGTAAVLLHDRPSLPPEAALTALTRAWGSAVAAAGQHEGARRLGEELAESNRALAEAQDRLLQTESMIRLGEMAAGAAHEMNNPLAVIAGRSQLLTMNLTPGSREHKAAQAIYEQSHRLSDLISALRAFADPPKPQRTPTEVASLLDTTVKRVCAGAGGSAGRSVALRVGRPMPAVSLDPLQIGTAVAELLSNALQAEPRTGVQLTARIEPVERHLVLQVSDDGGGMDAYTLAHAMDPFFSAKKAGRRVGMGLTRAQQLVAGHGGRIELRSVPDEGTLATILLPLDSSAG